MLDVTAASPRGDSGHVAIRETIPMIAQVYHNVTKSYAYVEHTATAFYAINEFGPFAVEKKIADGCLILVIVVLLTCHFVKVAGERCFRYRCRFEVVR